jgi:hypothetical protein
MIEAIRKKKREAELRGLQVLGDPGRDIRYTSGSTKTLHSGNEIDECQSARNRHGALAAYTWWTLDRSGGIREGWLRLERDGIMERTEPAEFELPILQ